MHHRVAAQRKLSGRPPLPKVHQLHNLGTGLGNSADEWLSYDGIDNAATTIMSFVSGFVYTPGETSVCSETIFTYIGAWVNSLDSIKKIYLPYVWPNFQANVQDILASGSGVIYDCDANKLFTTLTHLISTEGITELGARVAGAAPFELFEVIDVLGDETIDTGTKARKVGRLSATILNYHI